MKIAKEDYELMKAKEQKFNRLVDNIIYLAQKAEKYQDTADYVKTIIKAKPGIDKINWEERKIAHISYATQLLKAVDELKEFLFC